MDKSKGLELLEDFLIGLGILIVVAMVLAVITIPGSIAAEHNRQKVERLTQDCIAHGHTGWSDAGGNSICIG